MRHGSIDILQGEETMLDLTRADLRHDVGSSRRSDSPQFRNPRVLLQ